MTRPDVDSGPTPGLRHRETLVVETRHTVPEVAPDWVGFRDMPPVFATAMMIAFIEETCIRGLAPHLAPGRGTVGTHVDVSHVAATPVGMSVTADVELVTVERRSLSFRVAVHDEAGLIGEGMHRRSIIDRDRFMDRLTMKGSQATPAASEGAESPHAEHP